MRKHSIRKIAWLAALVALFVPFAFSQNTSENPPPYRGVSVHVDGVFVTPVPSVPLTAVVEIESTQVLADGSTVAKKTFNDIARDFQGRIYNERRQFVTPSFTGAPKILLFHIYDPVTRLNTFLDPATHLARQSTWSKPKYDVETKAGAVNGRDPLVEEEDLGTATMENVSVHGLRRIRTVPANVSGIGKPVAVVDEYWYSEELHLNMLVKHEDPRTGQQMVTVTRVERTEPKPTMFEIPASYKVVDETPENQSGN
jgi:hypothetical protein